MRFNLVRSRRIRSMSQQFITLFLIRWTGIFPSSWPHCVQEVSAHALQQFRAETCELHAPEVYLIWPRSPLRLQPFPVALVAHSHALLYLLCLAKVCWFVHYSHPASRYWTLRNRKVPFLFPKYLPWLPVRLEPMPVWWAGWQYHANFGENATFWCVFVIVVFLFSVVLLFTYIYHVFVYFAHSNAACPSMEKQKATQGVPGFFFQMPRLNLKR